MIVSYLPGKLKVTKVPPSCNPSLKQMGGKIVSEGIWTLPGVKASYYQLARRFGKEVKLSDDQKTTDWFETPKLNLNNKTSKSSPLYSFQLDAIDFLTQSKLKGSMLCLSPGLGKTVVSIIAAMKMGLANVLVIAPLSLLSNWKREIKSWGMQDATILHGGKDLPDELGGWVITNYDTAWRNSYYFSAPWDLIILDETVIIKNRRAKKINPILSITRGARKVWALSGSPITRFVDDLFAQFKILNPGVFTSYWRFAEEYCIVERGVWGWSIIGSRPGIDLRQEFSDIMFIRSQEEVLPDLPEVIYQTLDLELTPEQRKVYIPLRDAFIRQLKAGPVPVPNKIAQITHLQQTVSNLSTLDPAYESNSCKTNAIRELVETRQVEFPIIIWTHWINTAEELLKEMWGPTNNDAVRLGADHTESERGMIIEEFQAGKIPILILSMGTGKYGLTLTRAKTIIYHDRWFDADAIFQSSFRVKRIGLDHRPVCITLRCPGTIEDFVENNLTSKLADIAKVTNVDLIKMLGGKL